MAIEQYIVEGANFVATVMVDAELCNCPFIEAATKTLEYVFRHGPDSENPDNFFLMRKDHNGPSVGDFMGICKEGDIGNDEKMMHVKTVAVAENAGVLEIARQFSSTKRAA